MIPLIYGNKISAQGIEDVIYFKKSGNKALMKKIQSLVFEMETTPYKGTGKPEALKYDLSGYWSRRINGEHRIVYSVDEINEVISVYSLRGHYEK